MDYKQVFENGNGEVNKAEALEKALKKESKSFFGFFVKNYRITYLIIFAILAMGIYALFSLPREADPEVKIPYAVVTTVYPGANPADVEELVTNKIEDEVKNLDNLKDFTSSSKQSVSSIFVEFEAQANLQESYQKLRDAVDVAKVSLPADAEDPVVTEIRISDFAIVTYSLVCELPNCGVANLRKYTDDVKSDLEAIPGVSKVEVTGKSDREFQVIVDQVKLNNFNLSLSQVMGAIRANNFNAPAGDVEIGGLTYDVRVKGKFYSTQELSNLVVATYNNSPVYVRDVAQVVDGFEDRKTESRIGFPGEESRETISLGIYKKTGGNIIKIVDEANAIVAKLHENGRLPEYIRIEKTDDNAVFIRDTLSTLGTNGLETMGLIVLILFAVLGLRGSIITGLSVPLAFLIAFITLYLQGETLNSIVLYSLVISLGLMVDNSIIIMEGINEYVTKHGKNPLEAAILSVWNFKSSITSGTLTTVAAFAPMLLVSGILGQYFAFIPKTISATLLSSLFVALVVVPTLSSRFMKLKNSNGTNSQSSSFHGANNGEKHGDPERRSGRVGKGYRAMTHLIDRVRNKYARVMKEILSNKKKRRWTIGTAWILFALALLIPVLGLMKIEMFPAIDADRFLVTVELPYGVSLEETKLKTTEVERVVYKIPELKTYVTTLGMQQSFQDSARTGDNLASLLVNIVDKDERDRSSGEIIDDLGSQLKQVNGAKVKVEEIEAGPPSGAPIDVRIEGEDLGVLAELSKKVKASLSEIEGTQNVKDTLEDATGEFVFEVDRQQANFYGLDATQIASLLRTMVYGSKVTTVNLEGEDVGVVVKYDRNNFSNIESLENVQLASSKGFVSLKQVAKLSLEPALVSINHKGGKRIVRVTSQLEDGANLQKVLKKFAAVKESWQIPNGYTIEVGGEMEDITKSYKETFLSMIVAIILNAFILVLQFNSFRQPLVILSTLPLAVIGVIVGLNILGMSFSFPAFLGIVSLVGIAVNDAIVLIDRINKNLKLGMERIEAIVEAGVARMQPIFLTSLTTIAGVLPLFFSDEMWKGFSAALVFGLISSTVLTLVVVPALYVGFTKKEKRD